MSIDKELLKRKLSTLDKFISSIERMEFTLDEFVEDSDIHDLLVFRLQQAVETCIDIATHIIAQTDIDRKETAKDAFLALGIKKIIKKDLALKMGMGANFRNRVVHGYNDFDLTLLYNDYKNNLEDLREFGKQILVFLE
jgi:uncharacterized protein YutE (UPF0331/DUF86 family)